MAGRDIRLVSRLHLPDLALPLSLLSHLLDCLFALAEPSHNTVLGRSDGCWGGGIRYVINLFILPLLWWLNLELCTKNEKGAALAMRPASLIITRIPF